MSEVPVDPLPISETIPEATQEEVLAEPEPIVEEPLPVDIPEEEPLPPYGSKRYEIVDQIILTI